MAYRQLSVRSGRLRLDQLSIDRGEIRPEDEQVDDRASNEQQTQQLRSGHAGRHAVLRGRQRRHDVHVQRRTVKRQTERLGAHCYHAVPQVIRRVDLFAYLNYM